MTSDRSLDAFSAALRADDAEQLYDQAPCGYLSATPDGLIVKVNQTFLTLTGFTREALVGHRRFIDLLNVGGRIYYETHYLPMLLMQESASEIALEIVDASGGRLPVLVNAVLDRDSAGAPVVIRTAVFDATERRSYERELVAAKTRAEESEARATALARTLQRTLIPPSPPTIPGLDVAARYRPAGDGREVGGDFYDIFEIGPGDWVVAIGDVSGKGVGAAIVTSLARYTLRAACVTHAQPSAALAALNQVLLDDETEHHCTVGLVRLRQQVPGGADPGHPDAGWTATVALGGHPYPFVLRGGPAEPVGRSGSLLGILADPIVHDVDVALAPGESLVLFTDGITEGRGAGGFYGAQRLVESLEGRDGDAAGLADAVLLAALEFQSERPRDDIAVVALTVPR